MIDREALAAALEDWEAVEPGMVLILAAARERLAQLPETCGTCGGSGTVELRWEEFGPCPSCHGRGTVYPAEIVERIAVVLATAIYAAPFYVSWIQLAADSPVRHKYLDLAVAVLDALNDWKPE